MQREISRKRTLPAFRINIGDLDALWGRLVELFPEGDAIYASLEVDLPNEKLVFDTTDELVQYRNIPNVVTKFSLHIARGTRRISVDSSSFLGPKPQVRVTGETEAWCAGAVETVYSYMQSSRLWYGWFITAPIGWLLVLSIYSPFFAYVVLPKGKQLGPAVFVGWIGIIVTLALLFVFKKRLLPASILIVKQEDSFIRKYVPELSLAVALLTLVIMIIGLFIAK